MGTRWWMVCIGLAAFLGTIPDARAQVSDADVDAQLTPPPRSETATDVSVAPEAPEAYRRETPSSETTTATSPTYGVTSIATYPAPPETTGLSTAREDGWVSLHVDPLGFPQWGPVLKLEVGRTFTVHVRARAMNAGLINYFIRSELPNDHFDWGVGFGAGVRYYTGVQRGLLIGFAFELHYAVWKVDLTGESSETWRMCPGLELGYRWVLSNTFVIGLGADIAYVGVIASDDVFAASGLFLATPYAEIGILL